MEDWVKAGSRPPADLPPRQQEALAYLQANGEIPYRELRRHFPNQARELVDKGAAEIRAREKEAGMRILNTQQTCTLNGGIPRRIHGKSPVQVINDP